MTPLVLFELIVKIGCAIVGGIAVICAFVCLCIAVVSEVRDLL